MITVEHRSKTQNRITNYPAIGISKDGLIVLFYSEEQGTVLDSSGPQEVGEFEDGWDMTNFYLMTGEITLRNS